MGSIDQLRKRIKSYKNKYGSYPKINVSKDFWEQHAHDIAGLSKEGVEFVVDEHIQLKDTFLIKSPEKSEASIDTVNDLKKVVDSLVEEGKGGWPVVHMPADSSSYHKIKLFTIVPGNAPYEGLELFSSFHGAPEGEHILVQIEG